MSPVRPWRASRARFGLDRGQFLDGPADDPSAPPTAGPDRAA